MKYGQKRTYAEHKKDNTEQLLTMLEKRLENLKTQYNLFFAGEIRIPPEGDRESLEKSVRNLLYAPQKSGRNGLLIQNLTSKFALYNNMWKKKLNEVETGMMIIKKKPSAYMEDQAPKKKKTPEVALDISLNREDSFDKFYESYSKLLKKDSSNEAQKEKVINSLKTKLITKNLIDAKISLSVSDGKLKLKIKQ